LPAALLPLIGLRILIRPVNSFLRAFFGSKPVTRGSAVD
jgi:hypothetical protein